MSGEILFKDGKTDWKIYVPRSEGISRASGNTLDNAVFSYAAEELQTALKKVSGIDFPIIKSDDLPPKGAIVLGSINSSTAIKKLAKTLKLKKDNIEHIAVYTLDGNLYLAGNNPRACLYAVYSFLQNQLGVRWFWPGDDGEFITPMNSYTLPALAYNYTPSFRFREMSLCHYHYHVPTEIWLARNFLNGGSLTHKVRDKTGTYRMFGGHSVSISHHNRDELFKKNPAMFSLVDGKRSKDGTAGCWANEDFINYLVSNQSNWVAKNNLQLLNIFPADHNVRCECAECEAIPNRTLRWFNFYSKLQKRLKKKYRKLMFAGIAYQEYKDAPPEKIEGLEYIEYCQYDRCYVHKLNDPACKKNHKSLAELKKWQAKANMGIYGYEFDVFKPTMYVPFWNMLADEMKIYKELGLVRMKTELSVLYHKKVKGKHVKLERDEIIQQKFRLANYMYARLIWDVNAKPDAIIDDWCEKVFGPAADAMKTYHKAMAKSWDDMKIHLSYFGAKPKGTSKYFLSPEIIKTAETCFADAEKAAKTVSDPKRQQRILAEIDINRKFFNQWHTLYNDAMSSAVNLTVPKLTDASSDNFSQAAKLTFLPKKGTKKVPQKTEGFIFRTDDALRIKVICHENDMKNLRKGKTGRDVPNIWGYDNIELFIDCMDGEAYRHLTLNAAGGTYDALGSVRTWNPDWTVKTEFANDKWTADITIPFAAIGCKPTANSEWLLVVNRNSKPTACSFPTPSYHDLASGATISFSNTPSTAK